MGRRVAADAVGRLQQLQAITARLSGALTVDEVAAVVLSSAAALPGVVRGGLAVTDGVGRHLRFLAMHEDMAPFARLPWCLLDATADLPLAVTIRTRTPLWFSTLEELREQFPDQAARQAEFGSSAMAALPLIVSGNCVGALMVCYAQLRPFDETEQAFLGAFVEQAAQAVWRARAYELQEATAELLQRSLLPQTLPDLEGVTVGARYAPAGSGVEVGGDWFDVLALGDGRVLLSLGDVMGRGAVAAAVMGQMRAALRAYALLDPDPALVLTRLDAMLAATGEDEQLVTAIVGLVDADRSHVHLASAGHLPPVIQGTSGLPSLLDLPVGPPLGIRIAQRASASLPFPAGSTLILYTDGLVESRERPIDDGLGRLLAAVGELGADPGHPRKLSSQLVARLAGEQPEDDCAVLVITNTARRQSPTEHVTLPAEAASAAQARRWVRGVLTQWSVPEPVIENAQLCLSEIVTNALIHTSTPPRISATRDGGRLLVSVSDAGRRGAARRLAANPEDSGGRGLVLVEHIAEAWGAEKGSDGTMVWFELLLDEPATQRRPENPDGSAVDGTRPRGLPVTTFRNQANDISVPTA